MSNHKTIVVKQTSLVHRLIGTLFVFSMLLLCIYVSHGSAWWTFFTGTLFIVFLTGFLLSCTKRGTVTINTKDEALEWARSFPDDTASIKPL
ncbi:hypothetical protein SAMN05216428_11273 [Nitrosospira sp. Nsp11]|uniref:hypothetical protein n=1 Tax=Nitrosospira sp. Nsp11 TaxID=1855338 RepID=UPI00091FB8B7|nr:hypothetical protein [Nitrosospira sp. Nsp11]SHM04944.1 hypothetical protein SAMN05216428_11273 [Nitrosospira sp. Nsp11]